MHQKKAGPEARRPGRPVCTGPGERRPPEQVGPECRRGRIDMWDFKDASVVPVTSTS